MDIKADRQLAGRPCLTINVLPQFIKQVTNEQRQQRPSITVNPVGSDADVDTAEIIQGVTRHIEVNCDAEVAYDYAFEYMVRIGFGYWRLDTRYGQDGETQEIVIRLVRNPFCIYNDPNAQELDRSDGRWQFSMVDMPVSEFKDKYKSSKLASGEAQFSDYLSTGDQQPEWASSSGPLPTVRVAEYWYFDGEEKKMRWAKITRLEILDEEETIWDSPPNVGVYGEDLVVNGNVRQAGLVRNAKAAQQAKNYWTSATTEAVALAPKAPWVATKNQIGPYEAMYKQANVRNIAVLYYEPHAVGGTPLPPPQRQIAEPAIQAMASLLQISNTDLEATTGLYPANLGKEQAANESGKAVLARQKQGQVTNLNFSDNLARSIRRTGRMVINAMPLVYTEPHIQRIIKPDGEIQQVGMFNSKNDDKTAAHAAIAAIDPDIKKVYDIGVGTYDVTVSVGPSYQTKRQEAVETQMALVQAEPQLLNIIGDILVGNMDIPGAREISKRMKTLLPPQILQMEAGGDPQAQVSSLQAQLQAAQAQLQQAGILMKQQHDIIETKQVEHAAKVQIAQQQELSKQEIVKMQEATKLAVAQINASKDANESLAQAELKRYQIMHESAHDVAMQAQQQQHEQQLAKQGALQDQQSQQSDQSHELGMAGFTGAQQSNQSQQEAQQEQSQPQGGE